MRMPVLDCRLQGCNPVMEKGEHAMQAATRIARYRHEPHPEGGYCRETPAQRHRHRTRGAVRRLFRAAPLFDRHPLAARKPRRFQAAPSRRASTSPTSNRARKHAFCKLFRSTRDHRRILSLNAMVRPICRKCPEKAAETGIFLQDTMKIAV